MLVFQNYQDDIFGDAYYCINYRKNVESRKPINLPVEEDVQKLIKSCQDIFINMDTYMEPSSSYKLIRDAAITLLIIFSARRGGESARITINQWEEAVARAWQERGGTGDMLITFLTCIFTCLHAV